MVLIYGGTAQKFSVYYSKEDGDYRYARRYTDAKSAIIHIRQEIVQLLRDGKTKSLEGLHKAKLSPMFKGKILYLYYPEHYLNVFGERHVDYFLKRTGLKRQRKGKNLIEKRELLVSFKNSDPVMRRWTMYEFGRFLYKSFGGPSKPLAGLSHSTLILPPLGEQNLKPANICTAALPPKSDKRTPRAADGKITLAGIEIQNQKNAQAGKRGEELVIQYERAHLTQNGRKDLVQKVKQVSVSNANAGYDIESFDLNGKLKYIEVKTTTTKFKPGAEFRFHLSAGEWFTARHLSNYHLYIVFDIKSSQPALWQAKNPANLPIGHMDLAPSHFYATVKLEEAKAPASIKSHNK